MIYTKGVQHMSYWSKALSTSLQIRTCKLVPVAHTWPQARTSPKQGVAEPPRGSLSQSRPQFMGSPRGVLAVLHLAFDHMWIKFAEGLVKTHKNRPPQSFWGRTQEFTFLTRFHVMLRLLMQEPLIQRKHNTPTS